MKILNKNDVKIIEKELLKGSILILPTDTIYGLACDATNEDAIKKIYDIKQRDFNKPLNIHLSNKKDITLYASISNEIEQKLIDKLMPGAFTIVLKKKNIVSDLLTSNKDTVGIRIPNDPFIKEIIDTIKRPLVLTSTNISSFEPICKIEQLDKSIKKEVKYAVDVGEIKDGIESTVVIVKDNKVEILREGKITKEEINNILK